MVLPASSPLKTAWPGVQNQRSCRTVQCSVVHAVVAWVYLPGASERVSDECRGIGFGMRRGNEGRAGRKGESTHRNPGRDRTVCCTLLRYPDVSSSGRSPAQGFWNLFIARWVLLLIVKSQIGSKGTSIRDCPIPESSAPLYERSWPWSSLLVLGARRREKRRNGMHNPLFVHLLNVLFLFLFLFESRHKDPGRLTSKGPIRIPP